MKPDFTNASGLNVPEAECAAHAKAARVSLKDIEAAIAERHDFTAGQAIYAMAEHMKWARHSKSAALNVLSVCILVMRNGFTVIGKSACASPENFNAELGKKLAYEDAIRQLWPLMGFNLRQQLHEHEQFERDMQRTINEIFGALPPAGFSNADGRKFSPQSTPFSEAVGLGNAKVVCCGSPQTCAQPHCVHREAYMVRVKAELAQKSDKPCCLDPVYCSNLGCGFRKNFLNQRAAMACEAQAGTAESHRTTKAYAGARPPGFTIQTPWGEAHAIFDPLTDFNS